MQRKLPTVAASTLVAGLLIPASVFGGTTSALRPAASSPALHDQAFEAANPFRAGFQTSFLRVSAGIDAGRFDLGRGSNKERICVRVDVRDVADRVPTLVTGRTGTIGFMTDIVALNTLLMSMQLSTRALRLENAHPLPWAGHDPVISEPLHWTWRDSNFGDPYFNMVGHPLAFFSMSSYFRQCRGYGQGKSFLGGMVMNLLWETMWENVEVPHSLHDLMMNSLGALCGSLDGFGLAFGFDALAAGDFTSYYTEFFGETSRTTRVFLRFNPVEDFVTQQRLVPWILGLGFGYESEAAVLSMTLSAIPSTDSDAWDPSMGVSVLGRFTF